MLYSQFFAGIIALAVSVICLLLSWLFLTMEVNDRFEAAMRIAGSTFMALMTVAMIGLGLSVMYEAVLP